MAEKTTLFTALHKAQQSFRPAIKDTANPFFKSKYADLASIWEACKDALSENDLFVSQTTDLTEQGAVLITRVYHTSGEYLESKTPIICAKQNDPQAFGSAMTYTRRYSLAATLGIITDDDDGEGAMVRTADKVQPKPKEQPKSEPQKSATAEQKATIKTLLSNDLITPEEETKTLAALDKLTSAAAAGLIGNIEQTIANRTKEAAA